MTETTDWGSIHRTCAEFNAGHRLPGCDLDATKDMLTRAGVKFALYAGSTYCFLRIGSSGIDMWFDPVSHRLKRFTVAED